MTCSCGSLLKTYPFSISLCKMGRGTTVANIMQIRSMLFDLLSGNLMVDGWKDKHLHAMTKASSYPKECLCKISF